MQKFVEAVGAFALLSLVVMLSVNYLFGMHITYVQALVLYGLSNILFKTPIYRGSK